MIEALIITHSSKQVPNVVCKYQYSTIYILEVIKITVVSSYSWASILSFRIDTVIQSTVYRIHEFVVLLSLTIPVNIIFCYFFF